MSDLWATAMGTWCDDLADLMLPFDRLSLSRADLVFMGHGTPGFSYAVTDTCPDSFSQVLKSDLTIMMPHYPMGVHLRLDLCSFKTGASSPRVVGTNGALWLMRQPNPRVSGLIRRGLAEGVALSLYLFPWLPIPPWAEFRIFIRDGVMIGASQMHTDEAFSQIAQHEAALRAALQTFLDAALPRLPQQDLAIDVLAEPVGAGFRLRLVDLAPLVHRTDPCLFTWENGGDFDGTFRFHREALRPITVETTMAGQTLVPQMAPVPPPAPTDDDVWRI
jgi:D123